VSRDGQTEGPVSANWPAPGGRAESMKHTEHITQSTRAQVGAAVNEIGASMERAAEVRRQGLALAERLLGRADLFDALTAAALAAEEVQ
jgi:hypothetical protein